MRFAYDLAERISDLFSLRSSLHVIRIRHSRHDDKFCFKIVFAYAAESQRVLDLMTRLINEAV